MPLINGLLSDKEAAVRVILRAVGSNNALLHHSFAYYFRSTDTWETRGFCGSVIIPLYCLYVSVEADYELLIAIHGALSVSPV